VPRRTDSESAPPVCLLHGLVRSADFASDPPRFLLERAEGKVGARATFAKILPNERLKAASSLTLSHVHELVQDQLTIAPAIGPNDDSMTDGYPARNIGNDMGAPRSLSQLLIVRQWNPIDDQYFDTGTILNAESTRIINVGWP